MAKIFWRTLDGALRGKYEDSDSDADILYSLATDRSNASSDWGNTDLDSWLNSTALVNISARSAYKDILIS